ncbi:MAG: response regulator [Chitinophagaceae bacterium]|nr:MAG: response regulator [Chitinophagaceae bacterium]
MSTNHPDASNRKVLIVEDEGDMCLLLNIMLAGKDMELEHVKGLVAAEEFLQRKKNFPSVKIIMISGFDGAAKDAALECGADIYLEKPFTKAQLFQSLMDLLNEKEPA